MELPPLLVTAASERPARPDGTCFYCARPIGTPHQPDCVLVKKRVLVDVTVRYAIEVAACEAAADIEKRRNEGTWCGSNVMLELARLQSGGECLCGKVTTRIIGDVSEPYLDES